MSTATSAAIAGVGCGLCALASLAIAFAPLRERTKLSPLATLVLVSLVALGIRFGMSLVQDGGTFDIFSSYRGVGDQLRHGGDIFVQPWLGLSNYSPVIYWWWALAAQIVPSGNPHLFAAIVRAPFWICDAAIAPTLFLLVGEKFRSRAAWLYALNPIAVAVPTLHGQFDALPALALLLGVAWLAQHPKRAAWAVGVGAAIKTWPAYFVPVLLGAMRRGGRIGFVVRVAAVPAAAFVVYAFFHVDHILAGIAGVIFYVPHRQGLGTSRFFPDSWGSAIVPVTNGLLFLLLLWVAYRCSKRDVVNVADAVALSILLVLGLSSSVSDQYLMWPMCILIFAGRFRMAAVVAAALTPITVVIEVTAAGNPIHLPTWLLLPSSAVLWVAAVVLWRQTFPRISEAQLP